MKKSLVTTIGLVLLVCFSLFIFNIGVASAEEHEPEPEPAPEPPPADTTNTSDDGTSANIWDAWKSLFGL